MASPPSEAISSSTTADAANPSSAFSHVLRAPEVPIYAVMRACSEDTNPLKLNLGMGVYRTEEGKPLLLKVVRRAEEILVNDKSTVKEYLPITGLPEFNKLSASLIFGAESHAIKENRVVTVQSISGTGSLRIGADFLAKHYHQKIVYVPQPTYSNHPNFFIVAGLSVRTYRYYDPQTRGLDYQGLLEDLRSAPSGATVLFHACAHNPTGVDPTLDQWEEIRRLMRCKGLFPFFDCAYQGFVSGSLEEDARPVRIFVADGGECIVVQSFSKNMGLYGERVGALSIVCQNADVASRSESQLKLLIRPMYSSPPIHGAAIAAIIMKNRVMQDEWDIELKAMRNRLVDTRLRLYEALLQRGTPGDWSHIIKQVGLFTYSGLSEEQVAFLTREYHIYMPPDGRMNMAGLSPSTVPRLAEAIHVAVTMNI